MSDDITPRPMQARADAMRRQALGFGGEDPGPTPPDPSAPVNVDPPSVTRGGSVVTSCVVGDTLACTVGNWQYEPTDYWQSWLAGSTVVGSGPSYVTQAADAGQSVSCSVTATNATGSTNAPSNAVAVTAAG